MCRLVSLSDRKCKIVYELEDSNLKLPYSAMQTSIRVMPITDAETPSCVLIWKTTYSSDCDIGVIEDSKYRKREIFAGIRKTISDRKIDA